MLDSKFDQKCQVRVTKSYVKTRFLIAYILNRLDAKIDSKLGHVVMGAQPMSPYQQLIEKIDSLSVRSETLSALIDRKLKAKTDVSHKAVVYAFQWS